MAAEERKFIAEFLSALTTDNELIERYVAEPALTALSWGLSREQVLTLFSRDPELIRQAITDEYQDANIVFIMVIGAAPHLFLVAPPGSEDQAD